MMTTRADFGFNTDSSTVAETFAGTVQGKVILITGANVGGIGGSTATALASQNPKLLILTGRSKAKVDKVIDAVKGKNPHVETRFLELDLSSQSSVRKAAAEVIGYQETLDIVVNNAGVMALGKRELSPDGIEMQFATNHIGHFLFTNLIMSKLLEAAKTAQAGSTRIINVSSGGHRFGPVRFSDYNFDKDSSSIPADECPDPKSLEAIGIKGSEEGCDTKAPSYSPWFAYGQSKTANILFSRALNHRLSKEGIQSFALSPGSIATELQRHMNPLYLQEVYETHSRSGRGRKTVEQGSSTTLVAALDPALKADGERIYLVDCQLADVAGWAVDSGAAETLWQLSESIVKQEFPF